MFTIIGFYTEGTAYKEEADKLIATMNKFGLDTRHIESVPNLQNWLKNCRYRTIFIQEKLRELNSPVVWVDVDARILKYPTLFDNIDADLAVHYRWKGHRTC